VKKIFSNDLANKIYACIREDRYEDFLRWYESIKIDSFHEKLIFQAILEDGREPKECKNLQPYINFLMKKKPSVQLLALLIAQGEKIEISKELKSYSDPQKSVLFKSAIENKNIYIIKELFNHVDEHAMVNRLFYVGLQELLKDIPLTKIQCIAVLSDLCKKCEKHATIKSMDLIFYIEVVNTHFKNEVCSHLQNYVDNAKAMLAPDSGIITYESPIEYVFNDLPEIPSRLYYEMELKSYYNWDSKHLNRLREAQSLYLSISLEDQLHFKKEAIHKKKI
jgi:hypothetical protein